MGFRHPAFFPSSPHSSFSLSFQLFFLVHNLHPSTCFCDQTGNLDVFFSCFDSASVYFMGGFADRSSWFIEFYDGAPVSFFSFKWNVNSISNSNRERLMSIVWTIDIVWNIKLSPDVSGEGRMLSVFLLKDNIRKWVPPFLRCSRTSADTLVHRNCMWRLQHSPAAKGDNLYQHFLRKIYVGSFGIEGHLAPCGQRTDLRFLKTISLLFRMAPEPRDTKLGGKTPAECSRQWTRSFISHRWLWFLA